MFTKFIRACSYSYWNLFVGSVFRHEFPSLCLEHQALVLARSKPTSDMLFGSRQFASSLVCLVQRWSTIPQYVASSMCLSTVVVFQQWRRRLTTEDSTWCPRTRRRMTWGYAHPIHDSWSDTCYMTYDRGFYFVRVMKLHGELFVTKRYSFGVAFLSPPIVQSYTRLCTV